MVKKDVKKYLIVAALLIIAYLAFLIIKPFIGALITSFTLAYLFYPVYKKISKMTNSEVFGAVITTAIITIIMLLQLIYIANALVSESLNLYKQGIIEETTAKLSTYLQNDPTLASTINEALAKATIFIKQKATAFISNIPLRIIELIITIYATISCLIFGERLLNQAKKILPVKKKDELIKEIATTTHAIVYGLFVTAIIEFIIALIALKIIDSPVALLLGLTIGFLAFIPFLGPSLVWIPYAIIEFLNNDYTNVIILIILGLILFILEKILRAKIIGNYATTHPLIILIGTIGGIKLFGFIGLIAGPVILAAISTIIKEYYPEIKDET